MTKGEPFWEQRPHSRKQCQQTGRFPWWIQPCPKLWSTSLLIFPSYHFESQVKFLILETEIVLINSDMELKIQFSLALNAMLASKLGVRDHSFSTYDVYGGQLLAVNGEHGLWNLNTEALVFFCFYHKSWNRPFSNFGWERGKSLKYFTTFFLTWKFL